MAQELENLSDWRPAASTIPKLPGVYRFQDDQGRVIYVGKAKNLRNRLTSYFEDPLTLHPRTAMMVQSARAVHWTVVGSEVEALTLEFQWIKEFSPRFNVMFRDDKSYPYLSVTIGEEIPRVMISRERRRKNVKHFGPFTHVWALRETMDVLLRAFPVRTCSAGVLRTAKAQGRPCLRGYIEKCCAPCVGRVSIAEHRALVSQLCDFMSGRSLEILESTREKMQQAAANLDFERAAKKRDELVAMEKVLEQNALVLEAEVDADVYALFADELDAAVYVFYVRGGRIRGGRGWGIDRGDERSESELMADFLQQQYAERNLLSLDQDGRGQGLAKRKEALRSVDDVKHTAIEEIPRLILVSPLPDGVLVLAEWLANLRTGMVNLVEPKRGKKAELIQRVRENAKQALQLHKMHKLADLTERGKALEELRTNLGLDKVPLRIECYDISHTSGTNRVASMVVFEDGLPKKDAYRTLNIRGEVDQQDDTAAMTEVLGRRFRRLKLEEQKTPQSGVPAKPVESAHDAALPGLVLADVQENLATDALVLGQVNPEEFTLESGPIDAKTGKPRRFSYRPDLVVVDGGLPQVNAAAKVIREVGVDVPVIGLAKRLEQVWLPGDDFPLILPRTSSALYLLQHLRDESHRWAIRAHRQKRSKAMTHSVLGAVPGLGEKRQKALLTHFGSLKKIKAASLEQLYEVPGFGKKRAQALYDHLHSDNSGS